MALNMTVLGSGNLTRKNAVALIKDATSGHDEVTLFVSAQHFTDAVRFAADMADEASFRLRVYDTGLTEVDFDPADYPAAEFLGTEDGIAAIFKALSPGGTVLYAYDEDEPEGQEAEITAALRAGLTVLDLCGGLFPLELGPEDEAPPVTQPDEAQQAPVSVSPPPLQPKPETAVARLTAVKQESDEARAVLGEIAAGLREAIDVVAAWERYSAATTPLEQASGFLAVQDAISRLRGIRAYATA